MANLLANGKVLVSGGQDSSFTGSSSAELYDPASGTWTATGNLNTGHEFHTATLLANGMVLVAGGFDSGPDISASAELYNRTSGTWTFTDNLNIARAEHTATLLPNGMVLAAGGFQTLNTSAELYSGPTPSPGCTVTSTTCGRIIVGTAPTDFTINLSDPADPATVEASNFTVNGTPADNDIIINGDLTITFHFNTSPVVGGQNTVRIPAGAFNCGQGPVQEFTCTLFYRVPGATPPPRARPTPLPRPTPP
jgi:hypothetical protein